MAAARTARKSDGLAATVRPQQRDRHRHRGRSRPARQRRPDRVQAAAIPALISDCTHDYLAGPSGHVIEQTDRLGQPSAGGAVFLHADRLGSTRLLTDTSGQAVGTYTYTPTGQRIQADGLPLLPYAQGIPPQQTTTPLGFAGAYTDPGTGWLYLRHRYNDPTTDQFLTIDPALDLTGQPYNYADDDPANLTDATGRAIQHDNTSGSTALQAAQTTCDLDKQRVAAHKHGVSWYNPGSWHWKKIGKIAGYVGLAVGVVAVGVATFGAGDVALAGVAGIGGLADAVGIGTVSVGVALDSVAVGAGVIATGVDCASDWESAECGLDVVSLGLGGGGLGSDLAGVNRWVGVSLGGSSAFAGAGALLWPEGQ